MIGIISCGQKTEHGKAISAPKSQIEKKGKSSRSKPTVEIMPMKSKMLKNEIAMSYFVSDTIKKDFSTLIGTTNKWTNEIPVMYPVTHNGQLSGTFQLEDSMELIPFHTDGDMEEQIFTKWKVLPDSTLTYSGRLKPRLNTKYSFATIHEKVDINNEQYFIGSTGGGEGGEMWQSIWSAKYNGYDDFNKIDHYETSYNDGENIKKLYYKVDANRLSIILKTDSVIYKADSLIRYTLSEKVMKTIVLK